MRVSEVVTYLQMTAPSDLVPGRSAPVERRSCAPDGLFRDVQARVGAPHHWPTTAWTPEDWEAWLAVRGLHHWMFWSDGEAVGVLTVRAEPDAAEIVSFGLVPEATGRGLGGHALTLAVRAAWSVEPLVPWSVSTPVSGAGGGRLGGAGGGRLDGAGLTADRRIDRIWLHTSSLDHPSALPNYQRRGFQVFRTERRDRELTPPA
jgi:GNAT superfamily N-acetyltransferase